MYLLRPTSEAVCAMSTKHPERRWPKSVSACVSCEKKQEEISYGRRGLCISCANEEIAAGTIDCWPLIARGPRGPRSSGVIYKTVTHIGVTELGERLGVNSEEINEWLRGHPVPPVYKALVDNLLKEIKRITSMANRGCRHEEFFKYVESSGRMLDGKTL